MRLRLSLFDRLRADEVAQSTSRCTITKSAPHHPWWLPGIMLVATCAGVASGCSSNYRVLRTAIDDEGVARDLLGRTLASGADAQVDPNPIDLFSMKDETGWIVKAGDTVDKKQAAQAVESKVNLEIQAKCGGRVSAKLNNSEASSISTTGYVEATDQGWVPLENAQKCCASNAPKACGNSVITRVYQVRVELSVARSGNGELAADCEEVLKGLGASVGANSSSTSSIIRNGWSLVSTQPLSEVCAVLPQSGAK